MPPRPLRHRFTPGALVAALAGCTGGGMQPDGEPPPDAAPASRTYTYVVNELAVDPTDSPDEPHTGFNLDGLFSTDAEADGCNHADFFSRTDPDQHSPAGCTRGASGCRGGVDNQLPTIATTLEQLTGTSPREQIPAQINTHRVSLLVRLTDVDSLTDDDDVTMSLYLGYPAFSGDCTQVLPDQVYQVSRSSLTESGTTLDDARFRFRGRIVAGRLHVTTGMDTVLALPLPGFNGAASTVDLHAPQVRIDLTEQAGTGGNLGGWVLGNDVIDAVAAVRPDQRMLAESTVGGFVDIRVDGRCGEDRQRLGGISIGLGVFMVRARIDPSAPIAAARTPGTCGAGPGAGGG